MSVNLPDSIGPTDLYVVTILFTMGGPPTPPLDDGVLIHTCYVFDVSAEEASKRAISFSLIDPATVINTIAVSLAQMLTALHHLEYDQARHHL